MLLGGLLTQALNWHWIFLVNAPLGIVVWILCRKLLPDASARPAEVRLDVAGVITVTVASLLAVYSVVESSTPRS